MIHHATFVPFRQYTREQFQVQRDINGDERDMLRLIYFADKKNGGRGCGLSLLQMAKRLQCTHGQAKRRHENLRKAGLVVTIAFRFDGKAVRRARLRDDVKTGVNGAVIEFEDRGTKRWSKRKIDEKNPAIIEDGLLTPPAQICADPGTTCCAANNGDPEIENPIVPLPGARGDSSHFSFSAGQPDRILSSVETSHPATPSDPIATAPAVDNPGRRGRDWVALFHQLEFAPQLLAHFQLSDIGPALARKVVKRFRNGTLTAVNVEFVLKHLGTLRDRPVTLEALLQHYPEVKAELIRLRRIIVRLQAREDEKAMQDSERMSSQFWYFQRGKYFQNTLWCEAWQRVLNKQEVTPTPELIWSCLQHAEFTEFMGPYFTKLLTGLVPDHFNELRDALLFGANHAQKAAETADEFWLLEAERPESSVLGVIRDFIREPGEAAA